MSAKISSLTNPEAEEAGNIIVTAMAGDKLVIVCCSCDVEYDGRAGGYLPEGDRTVVIKPDGTFLVMGNDKVKPRNWQPSGAENLVRAEDDTLILKSHRTSPEEESLRVFCEDVYQVTAYDAGLDPDVVLTGTEEDMHKRIMDNPELIEKGFRPLEHERSVKFGSIDVFGNDDAGRPVIIEVKRRRAQLKDVDQLARYISLYREGTVVEGVDSPEAGPDAKYEESRGILVAPSASDSVKAALEDNGLEFVSVAPAKNVEDASERAQLSDF